MKSKDNSDNWIPKLLSVCFLLISGALTFQCSTRNSHLTAWASSRIRMWQENRGEATFRSRCCAHSLLERFMAVAWIPFRSVFHAVALVVRLSRHYGYQDGSSSMRTLFRYCAGVQPSSLVRFRTSACFSGMPTLCPMASIDRSVVSSNTLAARSRCWRI